MKRSHTLLLAITVLSGLLAGIGTYLNSAHAVSAEDWRAGNIISDGVFTNKDSMSVQDIQNFLDQRIGSCDVNGTQPATEYGRPDLTHAQFATTQGWSGPPYTCLNLYHEVPKTTPGGGLPANNYSNPAVIPSGAQSAAWIIKDAAARYNISPQVLLVKIATESAGPLTGDRWPLFSQYRYAMGSHCPDSGPNGTANCDSNYAGFSIQMYSAAELMRWYLDGMDQSWWPYKRPGGGVDRALGNPNAKDLCSSRIGVQNSNCVGWAVANICGGTVINIETKATAALYTYTPYQPNQASLNAYPGTGDSCSQYGNRNFWWKFNEWFGSGEAYNWQIVDQAAYLDANRTQRLSYYPSVQPGAVLYMQVKARNTGYLSWNRMTRLATDNPPGGSSILYDEQSWLSPNRAAIPTLPEVKSGEIATFNFTIKVPTALRTYNQQFILVQDGVKLFTDIGQNFTIDTTSPLTTPRTSTRSFTNGSSLRPGETILSADGNSALTMQSDGNLVLRNNFMTVWSTRTSGYPGSFLILQGDGNLVLYDKEMKPLWNSVTPGSGAHSLNLQEDANLVLYKPDGAIWSSGTNKPQSQNEIVNPRMLAGGYLYPGQRIETADRTRMLFLQGDGNLVLYDKEMKPLWNSGTSGKQASFLVLQGDGNLVLYDKEMKPLWNSGTSGHGSSRLILQDDTNLVIYKDSGQATWATYTNKK